MKRTDSCPNCGKTLNGHINIEDVNAQPKNGDVAICAYCEHILIVDGGGFHLPSAEEINELKKDEVMWNEINKYKYIAMEINDKTP